MTRIVGVYSPSLFFVRPHLMVRTRRVFCQSESSLFFFIFCVQRALQELYRRWYPNRSLIKLESGHRFVSSSLYLFITSFGLHRALDDIKGSIKGNLKVYSNHITFVDSTL